MFEVIWILFLFGAKLVVSLFAVFGMFLTMANFIDWYEDKKGVQEEHQVTFALVIGMIIAISIVFVAVWR